MDTEHTDLMRFAILDAHRAANQGDLRPFGCIIVGPDGQIIGSAAGSETPTDPTRHSEIVAIRAACEHRHGLLTGCTLYSTHEPCVMCCGAINHAKLARVVWGSCRADMPELFRQRQHSAEALLQDTSVPPVLHIGVLREECVRLFDAERAVA